MLLDHHGTRLYLGKARLINNVALFLVMVTMNGANGNMLHPLMVHAGYLVGG